MRRTERGASGGAEQLAEKVYWRRIRNCLVKNRYSLRKA